MTDLTAPWAPEAETWLRTGVVRTVATVQATHPSWAEPITLDVESGTVTFDEQWAPHVQAVLSCRLPTDQAVLDALDPRDLVRIVITAGYVYPGGQRDEHLVADLGLRSRRVVRQPGATSMQITAASDEALVLDAGETVLFDDQYKSPGWRLDWMIEARLGIALGYTPTLDLTQCPQDLVPVEFNGRVKQWDTIKGAVDVAAAWLRDRGDRTWVCTPWPTTTTRAVHLLRTGTNGTINRSEVELSREDWANVVVITYDWTDTGGAEHRAAGWAMLTGARAGTLNPSGPARPGIKVFRDAREGEATSAQARTAAAAILRRKLRSARSAVVTARAAWWVRPSHTVRIQLPIGRAESHLVSRVQFDIASGEMTVTTRAPDNTSIATGA